MINTIKSDLFNHVQQRVSSKNLGSSIVVPHVCNNIGVFGGGFTAAINNHFPIVATNFELLGKKTKLGYVQYINVFKDNTYDHELIFANMIAQNGTISHRNRRPINYEFLVKCMIDVRHYIQKLDKEKIEIHCPKFGSGLAGGDWNFITSLIEDIWFDIPVVVYQYNKRYAQSN